MSVPATAVGSRRVAGGILTSRVVGLVREIMLGVALGAGPVADAFRAAMRIPNLLQNLLGEGSISAAFVPVYARLVEAGEDADAEFLARRVLGLLATVVTAIVAVLVLAARPVVWLTTLGRWSGDRYELAIDLTRITSLGIGFLVLSAWCLGILNAHRNYLVSYLAPVVWSLAQIVALAAALFLDVAPAGVARWAAFAVVVGSIAQLVVQLPDTRRLVGRLRPLWSDGGATRVSGPAAVRTVVRRFVPAVGARGVVQIASYVDLALASLLVFGALATIALVMPLYLLAIAVFGFSVAVSELTEMSRTTSGLDRVAARVRMAQRRVLLPAGLVTAGAIGAGGVVIDVLYRQTNRLLGGGDASTAFTDANTAVAALTLAAFALGLPAAMVARVNQNALYALDDVRGPARIAVVRLAVAAVIGFLAMIQLDHLAAGTVDEAVAVAIADPGLPLALTDPAAFREVAVTSVAVEVADGPLGTIDVGGFPHWPPWEPLPHRESLVRAIVDDPAANATVDAAATTTGSAFVHYGAAGLGLGSAVASWTEFWLLRRRLHARLGGRTLRTGLAPWIVAAGLAAFVAARAVVALGLPSLAALVLVGVAVPAVYWSTLWFIGIRPRGPGAIA